MDEAQQGQELSDGLRDAFAAVARSPLLPDEKGRWQHRLIAITNSSKRDVTRARASLERFQRDWRDAQPS